MQKRQTASNNYITAQILFVGRKLDLTKFERIGPIQLGPTVRPIHIQMSIFGRDIGLPHTFHYHVGL
jgi:hypothetical protein